MTSTPRCTAKGCPVRFRSGEDRPCQEHGDTLAARMAAYTASMAATATLAPPGETMADSDGGEDGDQDDDQPTTLAAFLAKQAAMNNRRWGA